MTFLDLFAGIGGFCLGMEQAGHQCIGFVKLMILLARVIRQSMIQVRRWKCMTSQVYQTSLFNLSDQWISFAVDFRAKLFQLRESGKDFPILEVLLFFEIARFAAILQPKFLFLENVRGLLNHEGGATFETILRTLDGLGYDVEWQVLNSKAYVPQNRERIFLIGHSRDACTEQVFPIIGSSPTSDQNIRNLLNINPSNRGMGDKSMGQMT